MVYISRCEKFSSAHRLFNNDLSDDENISIYGKCANPNYHGHNYELIVTVRGKIDKKTGYVLDLKLLKKIMREHVVGKLDHKNLNLDVDFLKGIIPTTENILVNIWKEIEPHINNTGCSLHKIKLVETEKNYAEYYGEK